VELVDTPSSSGKGQKIWRCPQCRIAVWSNYAGAGDSIRFVRVGTLDEPERHPPDIHIYTESKQPWVVLPPSTPAVSEFYRASEQWPKESLERRAALRASAQGNRPGPAAPGASRSESMRIEGRCHCGNISYALQWPGDGAEIPVRVCGCSFCTTHGGAWTSHRDAELIAQVREPALVAKYRFGTGTADFHVCARCGAVPLVTSGIDDRLYAVVNVNTLEGVKASSLVRTATRFDGESAGDRLERRKRNWIRTVRILTTGA
jgi:hypothetical protein